MISCLAWIPKGAAKSEPEYAEFLADDIEALRAAAYVEAQPASGVCFLNRSFNSNSLYIVILYVNYILMLSSPASKY